MDGTGIADRSSMPTKMTQILLIEDEAMLAHNVIRYLARRGLSVDLANNVAQGRSLCEAGRYDVIILDVNLPDGNGLKLYADLRQRMTATRVIVISGNPADALRARCERLGACCFLTKPFALSVLARTVIDALSPGDDPPADLVLSAG